MADYPGLRWAVIEIAVLEFKLLARIEREGVPMNTSATLDSVRGWSIEDRLELAFGLWDQISETECAPQPSPELAAELQQRLARHDADPSRALSWEQVVSSLNVP